MNFTVYYYGRYYESEYLKNFVNITDQLINLGINTSFIKVNDENYSIQRRDFTSAYGLHLFAGNNRGSLFDKVSKTCFYNQGTGEFLYG